MLPRSWDPCPCRSRRRRADHVRPALPGDRSGREAEHQLDLVAVPCRDEVRRRCAGAAASDVAERGVAADMCLPRRNPAEDPSGVIASGAASVRAGRSAGKPRSAARRSIGPQSVAPRVASRAADQHPGAVPVDAHVGRDAQPVIARREQTAQLDGHRLRQPCREAHQVPLRLEPTAAAVGHVSIAGGLETFVPPGLLAATCCRRVGVVDPAVEQQDDATRPAGTARDRARACALRRSP